MAEKVLIKGNEALAEAALRAGARFYSGYPITPQTEILEYLAWRMPEVGGFFVQAESELCGINMVMGAAATGARAFTTSSGPGYSLKQEGISYLCANDLPAVIIDVMRIGSGLGDIFMGQGDYWQITRGGGHGDYHTIVLAPNSVQENVDMAVLAFDLAEKYCHPVIIASDAGIGQMMEPAELPDFVEHDINKFEWAVRGTKDGEMVRYCQNVYYNMWNDAYSEKFYGGCTDYPTYLTNKYNAMTEDEQRWESYKTEDAEVVLVAYGSSSRIAKETVDIARAEGFKLGLIRPITLWPFPKKAFDEAKAAKAFATVEVNILGQMQDDVKLAIDNRVKVGFVGDFFKVPDPEVIIEYAKGLLK
ncbi:MAG: 3-methyl-2-oxobutanoate dehydrogenase subunit VorB [Firmicutes bacterium]|nr:3-methyl-2-oxobutanoate dehydrogenase subunit VorB [Bacillota bacterium]MBQ9972763.1 3-methyl-2-oxobutanoate dehydrogenase subunit VorB [Bacillota bacterium]